MTIKRSWILALAILGCLVFAWATGAGRPYPASAGDVIDPTCTSSLPCIEYDNNGTGPGIRGVSLTGNGSNGITRVNSTSATNGREGVFGNDMSTSGSFNSGVRGLSVRGTGVLGNSTSGVGVSGVSTSGPGLSGTSSSGDGVDGSGNTGVLGSGTNIGVLGSSSGTGVQGNGIGGGSTGVSGQSTTGIGVSGASSSREGVIGTSNSFDGVIGKTASSISFDAGVEGQNSATSIAVRANGFGGPLFVGNSSSTADVFTVDDAGNVRAHSFTANLAASSGQKLVTYAPQASEPTIEDFGEAQLSNGTSYVHIDSRFAGTMAQSSYLVFITPEGDNRGLYVSQKSPSGFAVHESQGGHSTLAFSYRIVAKPFGNQAPRLPLFVERRVPKLMPRLHN